MKHLYLIVFIFLSLGLSACNGFSPLTTDVHTPDTTEADRPYEVDAGTDPHEIVCSEQEQKEGKCG